MSELQSRLSHLVNYSSQLIFVSGDSIADQQRALETFLSSQQENTEVAYFTAQPGMRAQEFRRNLCQQLLDQKVGSYIRPLVELMRNLYSQSGPFLVCIKQAQYIPNTMLQELWDWVIESRKQSNGQHLNIILFGETEWAEHAKQWLPQKNSDKPVLLATESVNTNTSFDRAALESLMSDRHTSLTPNWFNAQGNTPSLIKNKWFIMAIMFIFIAVFAAILAWQYPQQVKAFIVDGKLDWQTSMAPELNSSAMPLAIAEQAQGITYQPEVEVLEDPEFSANDLLVQSWQAREKQQAEPLTNEVMPTTTLPTSAPSGDFAVPDIVNTEQLAEQLNDKLIIPTSEPEPEQISPENDTVSESLDESEDISIESPYQFDEEALIALPNQSFVLQLAGIQDPDVLASFLQDNQLGERTWVYKTQRYGGDWYVVVSQQSYDSIAQARNAVEQLPLAVQSATPFAKSVRQVKQEIQANF